LQLVNALSQDRCSDFEIDGWVNMPQYFFAIRAGADDTKLERAAVLKDDAAAFAYACRIASELIRSVGPSDPRMLVKVRDAKRALVFSVPVLPACA
jgi:hypothetical protein